MRSISPKDGALGRGSEGRMIARRIGRELAHDDDILGALYNAALLKDSGCSSDRDTWWHLEQATQAKQATMARAAKGWGTIGRRARLYVCPPPRCPLSRPRRPARSCLCSKLRPPLARSP